MTTDRNSIIEIISEFIKLPIDRIDENESITDLVADSFLLVELLLNLQDALDIILHQDELEKIQSIGELISLLEEKTSKESVDA